VSWHGQCYGAWLQQNQAPQVENFLSYLSKHDRRIVAYRDYQQTGICIDSGAVESTVKWIRLRLKLSGAQWKQENVAQVLKQWCAYLNLAIAQAFVPIILMRYSQSISG